MKKLNDSQLSGENISKEDFKNLLHKIEEISKETKSIIIKIETGKNDEVNKTAKIGRASCRERV